MKKPQTQFGCAGMKFLLTMIIVNKNAIVSKLWEIKQRLLYNIKDWLETDKKSYLYKNQKSDFGPNLHQPNLSLCQK